MALNLSPATPRRPLGNRSESEPRASNSGFPSMLLYKSPASSYGDSFGSPTVPATPATVPKLRATPKRWPFSKLPSISEDETPIPPELQKYIDMTSTPYKRETFDAIRVAIHNAGSGTHEKGFEGFDQKTKVNLEPASDDDPFVAEFTPTKVNKSEMGINKSTTDAMNSIPEVVVTPSNSDTAQAKPTSVQVMNAEARDAMNAVSMKVDVSSLFEMVELVNDENAQALLPPEACIFVANLPRFMTDALIGKEVKDSFSKYGLCWVKVRRNPQNNTPHAFVQYRSCKEAHSALRGGINGVIGGRPCRTEMVVAPRTLYVSRKDLGPFAKDVLHNVLAPFGAIADICEPNSAERALLKLNPGYIVKMAYYQGALDAVLAHRGHGDWSVVHNHDVQCCTGFMALTPMPVIPNGFSECLFIGNLHGGTSYNMIQTLFGIYGQICFIQTQSGPPIIWRNMDGYDYKIIHSVQAFIYYVEPGSVYRALQDQIGLPPHSNRIHVQPRRGVPFIHPMAPKVFVRTEANSIHNVLPDPASRRTNRAMATPSLHPQHWP